MRNIVDTHIHLDKYTDEEISHLISEGTALITVSMNLKSCERNLALSKIYSSVQPAFGYHPEQKLPSEKELQELVSWIIARKDEAIAIGEVGLPYYLKKQNNLMQPYEQYIEFLEVFIKIAKQLDKPIILHAVYDDAPIVCDLLEKHTIKKAHFHWFKGDLNTLRRLEANQYSISITPDIVYEREIRELVALYPLDLMMVETDGPWPLKGPYVGKKTSPIMIHDTIKEIAQLKQLPIDAIYEKIYSNTEKFYIVKNN